MKPLWLLPLLFVSAAALAAADPSPTVGSVTKNNGRKENGRLIVRTPSILRVQASSPLAADIREAIVHYDRVLELPAAPQVRAEAMRRAAYLRLRLAGDDDRADRALLDQAIAL